MIRELGRTRLETTVKMKAAFSPKLFAIHVVVRVPVPKWTARATITVSQGKAKYDAAQNCLVRACPLYSPSRSRRPRDPVRRGGLPREEALDLPVALTPRRCAAVGRLGRRRGCRPAGVEDQTHAGTERGGAER